MLFVMMFAVVFQTGCTDDTGDLQDKQTELSKPLKWQGDQEKEVKKFLFLQGDFDEGYDDDVCYNITPPHIRENSDYLIFKYNVSCASFLLYDNEIFPMGAWGGGFGVTDMELADINNDGEMELYFIFSSGSGIHSYQAGYFDPKTKEIIILDYSHFNDGEMMLVPNDDGGLSLCGLTNEHIADIVFENNSIELKMQ